jgi:hypothetical protein
MPADVDLGALRQDIGSHSNRKGAATYLFALSTTLSAIAIYLRAGWSVGKVQDRYILSGAGSDQLIGRAVVGLPINSKEFAVLPPHLNRRGLEILRRIGYDRLVEGFTNYPRSFQRVLPYLFSSIVHHHQFLRTTLNRNHPFWNANIFSSSVELEGVRFSNLVDSFHGQVITGANHCTETNIYATGIPSHLVIVTAIEDLRDRVTSLEAGVGVVGDKIINHVTSTTNEIIGRLSNIPRETSEMILSNCEITGAVPVNLQTLHEAMASLQDHIRGEIQNLNIQRELSLK